MNLFHDKCGNPAQFRLKLFCTVGKNFGLSPEGMTKLNLSVSTTKPEPIIWDCPHCNIDNVNLDNLLIDCSVCGNRVRIDDAISTLYYPVICSECEENSKKIMKRLPVEIPIDRIQVLKVICMPERAKKINLREILTKIYVER